MELRHRENRVKLREIIKGVKEGRLDHNQNYYHCGSAHCIAGWYTYLEKEKNGWYYVQFTHDEEYSLRDKYGNRVVDGDYVQEECGLTPREADELFFSQLTIEEIVDNWNHMNLFDKELQV